MFYIFSDRDASEMTRRQSRRVISKERRRGDRNVFSLSFLFFLLVCGIPNTKGKTKKPLGKVLFRPDGFRFITVSFNSIE